MATRVMPFPSGYIEKLEEELEGERRRSEVLAARLDLALRGAEDYTGAAMLAFAVLSLVFAGVSFVAGYLVGRL